MIFNSDEFIVMTFLFMVGGFFGFIMTLNRLHENGSYDDISIILLSSFVSSGFFGIIGGGITLFFLPKPASLFMVATGGLLMSGVASIFTIEEKRIFVSTVIRRLITVAFNFKFK